MRRPICIISFIYILGIVIQYQLTFSKAVIIGFMFVNILVILYFLLKNKTFYKPFLIISIFLIAALNLQVNIEIEGKLNSFNEQEVQLLGNVRGASFKTNLQIVLDVDEVLIGGHKYTINETVISNLRGEYYPPEELLGKRVKLKGQLLEPEENRNPKMFNYRLYLKSKKIHSILYGNIYDVEIIDVKSSLSPMNMANSLRYKIVKNTLKILPDREGRVLLGILLGDKNEIDEDIYNGFKEVGVAHVLAISGLHVGIIYLFIEKLIKNASPLLKLSIIYCVLSIYIIITGYAPSIIRATFMILLLIIGPTFNRKYDSISAIAFTAFVLLVYNPLLLFNTGFQLSFGAVLSIALLYKPILKKLRFLPSYLAELLAASVAAQVGIIPLTAYYFNMISPWSLIINIPVVALLGYILPFGIIAIVTSIFSTTISMFMGEILGFGLRLMIGITNLGTMLPFSGYLVISPSIPFFIMYYLILFILLKREQYSKQDKVKLVLIVLTVYITTITIINIIPGKLELTFLDVGQGDCIIIRTPKKKTLMIDGGGNTYGNYDVGEKIVVPYLLKNGIRKIDYLLVSHFHYDHVGGLYKVLEYLDVKSMLVGEHAVKTEDYYNLIDLCSIEAIEVDQIYSYSKIELEKNLYLHILSPSNYIEGSKDDANNNSVVALLEYYNHKILFTGDIEAEAENSMLTSFPNLKADILKVPHHGSNYSSTDKFIAKVSPQIAVIQVGRNIFGHPHEVVLEKLNKINAYVFRNDENGAIIISIDKEKITIKTTLESSL